MSVLGLKSETLRFLNGLISGELDISKAYEIIKDEEGVLIYFLLRYLREKNPSEQGIIQRVLELSSNHPELISKAKEGEKDSMVEWFDDTYSIRQFGPEEFADLIIDKLEG